MIFDILSSAGFGTLIGAFFGYLNKKEENKSLKMQFQHDLDMVDAKTDQLVQVGKMKLDQVKAAGALAVEKAEAEAFTLSQKSTQLGDTIRACIRPVILALLLYQSYEIINSLDILRSGLDLMRSAENGAEEYFSLVKVVVLSVLSLTSTAVGWYFGTRSSKQFDALLKRSLNKR